ncbi:MAG: DUF2087 domain-containing protein [Chloroflexi bacterium]|nr:DUF2087 domain-containing protein [Chloroflexota bacterium]
MSHITVDQFKDRFVALVLGGRDLPKKRMDLHTLLISATLKLEPARKYSENELNIELRKWAKLFGGNFKLDFISLRRFLVDEGYLRRDAAGGSYELVTTDLPETFDPSIASLDLEELIYQAKEARELKKSQYVKRL